MKKLVLFYIFLSIGYTCVPQPADKISFSLYMIGNTGKYSASDPAHINLLQAVLNNHQNKKGIIFLGNNVYPSLSDILSDDFDEKVAGPQIDSLRRFNGPICFIPGWTDWAYGTSKGKEMIKWEYKTIHNQLKDKEVYMPDWGCPGPVEVEMNDSLTIILLDTQWWLHPFDVRFGKCDIEEKADVWTWLQDALRRNRNKQVVVAGYHPVVSYGEFGGYYPTLKEVFEFPISFYRKHLGTRLDLAHPDYKEFSDKLKSILEEFPNVIYASSHERNFQYIKEKDIHYIIGGSLAGGKYIKDKKLECGSRKAGYTRLDFYHDGRVELLFFALDNPNTPLCRSNLYTYKPEIIQEKINSMAESIADSISQPASQQYDVAPSVWKWMGKNYRDIWAEPVRVKVFDIEKEHSGLEILKRGGGQQTHSLRLQDKNGHQYSLRSLEKYVEGALPSEVKNTFAIQVVQDNISASNPYAALPAAKLADVAGIFHTNPQIVYVPHDYRLGEYMEDLSGHLFLYEERPANDWSNTKSFGFSSKIIGTDDVIEKAEDDADHQVDQQAVLKARIFDTFINDWDRHDDQWRWASFKENGNKIYRPIPRDRDQAFYVNEGIIPKIASQKWLMPKIQGFAPLTPNMKGLTFNARYFDRSFLTEPDWAQWKLTIDSLKTLLSDEQIDNAMKSFPKEVQPLCADQTANILKKRRDNLEIMAREHYLALAKMVNIVGTNKNDLFEVNRKDNDQTEVSVYELSKKHKQKQRFYHRVFTTNETNEIRLYGLNGDDYFKLDGKVETGIKIRVVGGKGKDTIISQSTVKAPGKQTLVYDLNKNTRLISNQDTKDRLTENKKVNNYDRMDFHYNVVSPGLFLGYNPDDGLFIGGGPVFNQYKFRRHNTQAIMANLATRTSAFNVRYNFDSKSELNGIDHHLGFELKAPDYVMNYFGMGNENEKSNLFEDYYYRLNVNQLMFNYSIGHRWGKTVFKKTNDGSINQSEFVAGVFLKRSNIEANPNYFISDLTNNGLDLDDLDQQFFTGFFGQYTYTNLDEKENPKRGFILSVAGKQFFQVDNQQDHFLQTSADLRAYISFTKNPRTVFAFRLGGASVFGNYSFLEAAKLGGKTNLRGYLADQFYGDQSVYQNSELRFKLFDFSSYILNGEFGLLAFYDVGRVWLKNEKSDAWHKGYGSGFWISPFEMTIFTATYNWSKEDHMLQIALNFKF